MEGIDPSKLSEGLRSLAEPDPAPAQHPPEKLPSTEPKAKTKYKHRRKGAPITFVQRPTAKHEDYREDTLAEQVEAGLKGFIPSLWLRCLVRGRAYSPVLSIVKTPQIVQGPPHEITVDFDLREIPGLLEAVDGGMPQIYQHINNGGDNAVMSVKMKFTRGEVKTSVETILTQPGIKQTLDTVETIRENGTIRIVKQERLFD